MNTYMLAGRMNAVTGGAATDIGYVLWNASTTKTIYVREVWHTKITATGDNQQLIRTSTIGTTPGSTITPDIDNDVNRALSPPSTAVVHTSNFATEPTQQGPPLAQTNLPAAIGAGFIWVFNPAIAIPQTTGLSVSAATAVVMQIADFTFVWDE